MLFPTSFSASMIIAFLTSTQARVIPTWSSTSGVAQPALDQTRVGVTSVVGLDTFASASCQAFEEFIHITQAGNNANSFPGPRVSFEILETDDRCDLIFFDAAGATTTFPAGSYSVGECVGAADGRAFVSFNMFCH